MNPWDRLDGETPKAWGAFQAYLALGPTRSVLAAYQQTTGRTSVDQAPGTWQAWSARFGWVERAEFYDSHLAAVAQKSVEETIAEEAAKWARRQMEQREEDFKLAGELRSKVREMLAYPITREVEKDGVVVTEPARWNLNTVARMSQVSTQLARLACEMATSFDVTSMSDDELEALLRTTYSAR